MDTSTGQVGELTQDEERSMVDRIRQTLGRDPVPGDRVDADPTSPRVLVSPEAARKLAKAQADNGRRIREQKRRHSDRKVHRRQLEKQRAKRKRREARQRAQGAK